MLRSFAERQAINAPIQGTASDLIKIAMLDIHRVFRAKQMQIKNDIASARRTPF
jgi:DNA polymerase-1